MSAFDDWNKLIYGDELSYFVRQSQRIPFDAGRTSMKADILELLNKSTARSPEHQALVKELEGME
jgi:hypothetical protein